MLLSNGQCCVVEQRMYNCCHGEVFPFLVNHFFGFPPHNLVKSNLSHDNQGGRVLPHPFPKTRKASRLQHMQS